MPAGDLGPPPEESVRYRVRDDVAVESFGETSLVLLCDSLQLFAINPVSAYLIDLARRQCSPSEMASALAAKLDVPRFEALDRVADGLEAMERQGILRRRPDVTDERNSEMSDPEYLANPDVSFRAEDEDGGILFNADTGALEVMNPVAVEIWTYLSVARTQDEIVRHLCSCFLDAPVDRVRADVGEFLESYVTKGLVGIVEARI